MLGLILILLAVIAFLIAWRYPQMVFYAWIATAPLIGWTAKFSTGYYNFFGRTIGGSIELGVGELVAGALFAAWLVRLIFFKQKQKIFLPLFGAFGLIVAAHLLSVLSPLHPDAIAILKYSLRPVLWAYIACVLLPANFLRSRRDLIISLAILSALGAWFALQGIYAMRYGSDDQTIYPRAHPLSLFGVYPIGNNHNVLAEFLAFVAPCALALGVLIRSRLWRRIAFVIAGLTTFAALLTFARSAWIVLAVETGFLSVTLWWPWIKKNLAVVTVLVFAFLPLGWFMLSFMNQTGVQSSTDTRLMLSQLAYSFFRQSPVVGAGAGTFVDRVSQIWIFNYEFGAPLDSHGLLQKVMAETGVVGLLALALFGLALIRHLYRTTRVFIAHKPDLQVYLYLAAAVIGAFVYQLFNTTYWTSHLWFPVGIVLAAGFIFQDVLTAGGAGGEVSTRSQMSPTNRERVEYRRRQDPL